MAPVEQGAIGGAEVFDIPEATNGLETSVLARGDTVSQAPTQTMITDVAISGRLAQLSMNGILLVRMT